MRPGLDVDASGRGTFAVVAPRAHRVELCVLREGREHRRALTRYEGGMWWDRVEDMTRGTLYGLRADGPWDPAGGSFFNPARVMLDPRAGAISHSSPLLTGMFPHEVDSLLRPVGDGPLQIARTDSAADAVWSVVLEPEEAAGADGAVLPGRAGSPRIAWSDTVIYEAHVRGLTARHGDLPPELRGTYAGLAHPAVTDYLRDLGVTAVELLPIHAAMDEPHLARMGMTNYWGYSTLSYFAPEPAYATRGAQDRGAQAVVDEVRAMVQGLHAAGLEVICDVVYNHTAEGGPAGPSLSLKGLDAHEHIWMQGGSFVDFTGTGVTLDMRSPHVVELILDSLRHWVTQYGIDGFRFDLAATLGRDDRGFRADHPLLRAMRADPLLRTVKLIAEPWDVGGYGWQTGSFPPPFAEWNDAFRDDVRSFWLADPAQRIRTGSADIGGVRDIATRLAGSADLLTRHDPHDLPPGHHLRAPWAGVNYLTAHDGFTLHDLTAYDRKHNEANGEDNRDGTDNNRSRNHGAEGPVEAGSAEGERIDAARRRSARSLMATLVLAAGTPLITAGDEARRTQQGNNNAYCQDNDISYVSWERDEHARDMVEVTRRLLALRRRYERLRPDAFLRPADPAAPGRDQITWLGAEGAPLRHEDWFDNRRHTLQMLRPGAPGDGHLVIVVNGSLADEEVTLPGDPWPAVPPLVLFSSADERPRAPYAPRLLEPPGPEHGRGARVLIEALSVCVLLLDDEAQADPLL